MTKPSRTGRWARAVGPRHAGPARNSLTALTALIPIAIFLGEAIASERAVDRIPFAVGLVLCALCAGLILAAPVATVSAPLGALVGIASIVVLDLSSHNAGMTGQLFFCMPVLYAAVHLRVPGVVIVTAAAVIGDAVVVTTLLPLRPALLDLIFIGGVLVLMAAALARSGIAQDRLVGQLRRLAEIDPLTGLVTRRGLDDATQRAIDHDSGVALVVIDVDHFKTINDTYGHAVGDDALVHIAAVLSSHCRDGDLVSRMGGDELAVLMPGCSYANAVVRATRFTEEVRATPLTLPDGRRVSLSISAGAARAPGHAANARDLYTSADAALYAAKRTARGTVGRVEDIEIGA